MTMLAVALLTIVALLFHLRRATPILHLAIDRPASSHPRSPPEKAPNPPRQKTGSVQIPIAPDAPPRHIFRGFLVWGFFCQGVRQSGKSLPFVSFFVRSQSPFLRPDPRFADVVVRRSCQGWPSRQPCGMPRGCQAIP